MSERISHHHKECAYTADLIRHETGMCEGADGKTRERRVAKADQRTGTFTQWWGDSDRRQRQRRGASQVAQSKSEYKRMKAQGANVELREDLRGSSVESAAPKACKFFLDTEFIETGRTKPVTLISIGIVAEDGRKLYAVSSEFNEADCGDWVKANVLPHLGDTQRRPIAEIAAGIKAFVGDLEPEFWGYYADYDWVVFCQMFGAMIDLPKGWPMFCRDIKQLCADLGNPKLPKQQDAEHHALADANWNKSAWEYLTSRKRLAEWNTAASSPVDKLVEALLDAVKLLAEAGITKGWSPNTEQRLAVIRSLARDAKGEV